MYDDILVDRWPRKCGDPLQPCSRESTTPASEYLPAAFGSSWGRRFVTIEARSAARCRIAVAVACA